MSPMASMALTLPFDPDVTGFDPPQAVASNTSATATVFMLPVIASHGNSCAACSHSFNGGWFSRGRRGSAFRC